MNGAYVASDVLLLIDRVHYTCIGVIRVRRSAHMCHTPSYRIEVNIYDFYSIRLKLPIGHYLTGLPCN